jgi:hypothetical protein
MWSSLKWRWGREDAHQGLAKHRTVLGMACEDRTLASSFGNGQRWLWWTTSVEEQQNMVIVTSSSSTLGWWSSGHAEEVWRWWGEEARVWRGENEPMGWQRGLFIGVRGHAAEQHHDHKSQLNCTLVGDLESKKDGFLISLDTAETSLFLGFDWYEAGRSQFGVQATKQHAHDLGQGPG